MPDFIGNIPVPDIEPTGVFPLVSDYPVQVEEGQQIQVHRFGTIAGKIEQRFKLGAGTRVHTVLRKQLTPAHRKLLADFWETNQGVYGAFTYHAPNPDGTTTDVIVRFQDQRITFEALNSYLTRLPGLKLVEISQTPTGDGDFQNIPIYSSGVNRDGTLGPSGVADINWVMTESADSRTPGPDAIIVTNRTSAWTPNLSDARWIGPQDTENDESSSVIPGGSLYGTYKFVQLFDLTGLDPTTAVITLRWAADNNGTLRFNGAAVDSGGEMFGSLRTFSLTRGFLPGINTLEVDVVNENGPSYSPIGCIVEIVTATARLELT